jgi:putative hydrolase of the HAD superfamily
VIPFDHIETLFLDIGNTLVSIDFDKVAGALASLGFAVDVQALRRAEAASRPVISKRLAVTPWREPEEPFVVYLRAILKELERVHADGDGRLGALVPTLAPTLRGGRASDLWSSVMPKVPDALQVLKELGLRMAAVSNSDGTAERMLERVGLRDYLDVVVDSAIVGYEKPDPRIFEHAVRLMNATGATTLHVGDLYDADVAGARAAGLHALLLDPFGDWGQVDCETMPDLPTLARRLAAARGATTPP